MAIKLLLVKPRSGGCVYFSMTSKQLFMLKTAFDTCGVEIAHLIRCPSGNVNPCLLFNDAVVCPSLDSIHIAPCPYWQNMGFVRACDTRTDEENTFTDIQVLKVALKAIAAQEREHMQKV